LSIVSGRDDRLVHVQGNGESRDELIEVNVGRRQENRFLVLNRLQDFILPTAEIRQTLEQFR
jgi:hypothetical protein